jgi:hypothetical protein
VHRLPGFDAATVVALSGFHIVLSHFGVAPTNSTLPTLRNLLASECARTYVALRSLYVGEQDGELYCFRGLLAMNLLQELKVKEEQFVVDDGGTTWSTGAALYWLACLPHATPHRRSSAPPLTSALSQVARPGTPCIVPSLFCQMPELQCVGEAPCYRVHCSSLAPSVGMLIASSHSLSLLLISRVHPNTHKFGLFVGDESREITELFPEMCSPVPMYPYRSPLILQATGYF